MLQHFRANLDNWDPALTDALAAQREIILVDYPGVGSSTGEPSSTIAGDGAADDRVRRRAPPSLRSDLLGFSIGGFVAQQMALVRPALIRRLVPGGHRPKGAPGMHGWREDIASRHRPGREQAREPPLSSCSRHIRREPGEGRGVTSGAS